MTVSAEAGAGVVDFKELDVGAGAVLDGGVDVVGVAGGDGEEWQREKNCEASRGARCRSQQGHLPGSLRLGGHAFCLGAAGGLGADCFGASLFEAVEALEQLGKALEDGDGAQPDAIVEAGRAGDHFAGRDVVRDGGLRGEDDAVADGAMAGDADLAGENDVVADDGGAGEAGLRAESVSLPTREPWPTWTRLSTLVPSPISVAPTVARSMVALACTSTRLPMRTGPDCGNFFPVALLVFGEAEAVAADDDAVFERDVVAEDAVFADDGVGVREKVAADLNAGIEHDVRQNGGVRAEAHVGTDDGVCADVGVCADFGRGIDDGGGMNAGRIGGRLIEEAERAREGVVGVLDAQGCGGDFLKFGLDEDGGGVGGAGERGVARIGDEGDFGGAGFFNAFDAGDFEVGVAAEFRAQPACQFA